jgi:hypothetical protein
MNFHLPTPVYPFWLTLSNSEKTCDWLYLGFRLLLAYSEPHEAFFGKSHRKRTLIYETGRLSPFSMAEMVILMGYFVVYYVLVLVCIAKRIFEKG